LATTFVAVSVTSTAKADNWRLQRFHRRAGLWFSSGYHWRTPGPNPDYYNPYTAHNSHLIYKGHNAGLAPAQSPATNFTIPNRLDAGPDQRAFPHNDLPGVSVAPDRQSQPLSSEAFAPRTDGAVDVTPVEKSSSENDENIMLKSGRIQNNNDWPVWEEFMPTPKLPRTLGPSRQNQ
jgi:hypothetical protein